MDLITEAEWSVYSKQESSNWVSADGFLAGAMLFPETILVQNEYNANIELHGELTRGQVVIDHSNKDEINAVFVEKFDYEKFKEVLIQAASAQSYKVK